MFGFASKAEAERWNVEAAAGGAGRMAMSAVDKEARRDACRNRPPDKRWMRTRSDDLAVEEGCWFDEVEAERVCDWLEHFCKIQIGDDAGENMTLMAWERDFVMQLFGWKLPSGNRRIRKALLWIPKKNGKTTLAAALSLFMLVGSGENAPRNYCVAGTKEQGDVLFDEAASMIEQNPILKSELVAFDSKKEIVFDRKSGTMHLVAAKIPAHLDGKNVYFAIIDEYHTQKSRRLFDILNLGTAARNDGLTLVLSTTGEEDEGPLVRLVALGESLLDPEGTYVDATFLPVLYTAPPELAWDSREAIEVSNPSFGYTVQWEFFKGLLPECRVDPVARAMYERKHLNRIPGRGVGWVDLTEWDACDGLLDSKGLESTLEGMSCYGGLDLAFVRDFVAFVMSFPLKGGRVAVLPHFWIPENSVDMVAKQTSQPLRDWADYGYLELVPGNVINFDRVIERIEQYAKRFDVCGIGYDPWQATQTALALQDTHGLAMVEIRQQYQDLTGPSQQLNVLLGNHALVHGGHPVLRWHAKCLQMKMDPVGNCKPIRPDNRVTQDRIDGMVSLIMSLSVMGCIAPKEKRRVFVV